MKELATLFAITAARMLMTAGCETAPVDLTGCCCTDKGKACEKADVDGDGCGCGRCGKNSPARFT